MRSWTASRAVSIEHRDAAAPVAQPPADLEPVDARQADVEDDAVRHLPVDGGERRVAVLGQHDVVSGEPERATQGVAHGPIIIDHEDAHGRSVRDLPKDNVGAHPRRGSVGSSVGREEVAMAHERYVDEGEGPAVIFNHGTLMDASMFDPQLDYLAGKGYRAIAQNNRALLGKATPHTLDDLADDVLALADDLGLARYVVAGMSTGAFSALQFALRHPGRAAGFILIEGQACAYPEAEQDAFEAEFARFDVDGMVAQERAEWAAPFCFGEHIYATNPGLVEHWIRHWTTRIPSRAVWAQGTSWVRKDDVTARLREIAEPVLIIHAEGDLPVPIARAYAMLEHLTDATFVKIPRSGHTSNLENPDAVNHAILGFLERIHGRLA